MGFIHEKKTETSEAILVCSSTGNASVCARVFRMVGSEEEAVNVQYRQHCTVLYGLSTYTMRRGKDLNNTLHFFNFVLFAMSMSVCASRPLTLPSNKKMFNRVSSN